MGGVVISLLQGAIINNDTSLSKEERQFLINNLHELYIRHEDLIQQAGNIMKQIAAINKILIIGIE